MGKNTFFILLLVFLLITFVGCSKESNNAIDYNTSSVIKYYSIISTENYNTSLCSSAGYGVSENGLDWGLRIIIKDKDTNENISGYASYTSNRGGGGVDVVGVDADTSYTCEENVDSSTLIIYVYSAGHSPIVFSITPSNSSLMTIEVLMTKSCSGAPSCFDNFEIQNSWMKITNKTYYDILLKDYENSFYDYIDRYFQLNRSDYILQCMECNMGRGGYVKAKGIYKNGTDLELYYHWGWCSSGGTDCGYSMCIATNSKDFMNAEKAKYCDTLTWNGRNDGYICTDEAFNNDTIIRNDCLNGKFENQDSGRWSFAFGQGSNRCSSSITNLSFDCMGN